MLFFALSLHLISTPTAADNQEESSQSFSELHLPRNAPRFALIIVPAGDTSLHTQWLKSAETAGRNWDVALMYFGEEKGYKCKECVGVLPVAGAKWHCLSAFLNSSLWTEKLSKRYEAVMVADDDLTMRAGVLNRFFKIFRDFRLTIGQPAVCRCVFHSIHLALFTNF